MDFDQITILANTIKGAPLSCLFVLALARRPLGNLDLCTATGYGKDTIRSGLAKLQTLGLAEQKSRYHGWELTAAGYHQLNPGNTDLGELSTAVDSEGENLALPVRSSSFKHDMFKESDRTQKQLQLPHCEGEKIALVEILIGECGCPTRRAQAAAEAALGAGSTAVDVELSILRWLAYCRSERGEGITNRGIFIAAKIERSEPCPPDFRPEPGTDLADRIKQLQGVDENDPWIR